MANSQLYREFKSLDQPALEKEVLAYWKENKTFERSVEERPVTNPFVFSEYDGFDPEWATATYAKGGMSFITYQLGVNAKF